MCSCQCEINAFNSSSVVLAATYMMADSATGKARMNL